MNKSIPYTSKRFSELKQSLLTFAKSYFPTTHTDFSDESVGTMFVEMMAAVGDVTNFYQDAQFQEVLLTEATDLKNLYSLAYQFGYKPKPTKLATVPIDIYQTLPAKTISGSQYPDYNYALQITSGTQLKSTDSGVGFYIEDSINFGHSSSFDPTEVVISNRVSGSITEYQLKKKVLAVSGDINTVTVNVGTVDPYYQLRVVDNNIASIISVIDSEGNNWYEVDYLAQDHILKSIPNNGTIVPDYNLYQTQTPLLVNWKWTPRRFVSRFLDPTTLVLEFGSGTSDVDSLKLINLDKYGLTTIEGNQTIGLDPDVFLRSNAYGLLPQNTTLTITYITGGGVTSNVQSGQIENITSATITVNNGTDANLINTVMASIAVSNPEPASGGRDGDTVDEIRQTALGAYSSQMRAVTANDYRVRVLAMEPKYGSVSRCFVQSEQQDGSDYIALYALGNDELGNFSTINSATKYNIMRYLEPYKLMSDKIVVRDAFPVTIGVNYQIIVSTGYSSLTILNNCTQFITDYFDKSKWDIGQPILLSDLYSGIAHLDGVQSVSSLEIINKTGLGFSNYEYDIKSATRNGIIYTSVDKMIFELRDPINSIKGTIINY